MSRFAENILQDLRYGARALRRSPGFAIVATLILALGIGLSTAVFTVANAILLRRLPVGEQERLVVLWGSLPTAPSFPVSVDDAREVARRTRALDGIGFVNFHGGIAVPIRDGDRVYRLRRAMVSGNFFDVLRTTPALGRTLRVDDDLAGASPVVVLSYRAWQQQFGGDSAVVGRTIVLHQTGQSSTVVGVMPQGLDYPRGTDMWAPLVATSTGSADSVMLKSLHLVGRLRAGATEADAKAELTEYFRRPDAPPQFRDFRADGRALTALVLGDVKRALIIFSAAAGLLLLLTCINVANLLLVRGLTRAREIAVRSALGAERGRLVSQLFAESGLLAVGGGAFGVLLAWAGVRGFIAIAPSGIPRLDEVQIDARTVLAAILITALATFLFALAPAFITSRIKLQDALRSGARDSGGRRLRTVTDALVSGQIGIAVVVLLAAGLISKSLMKLQQIDLAFEPKEVIIAELALRTVGADAEPKGIALLDDVLARVAAVPGVESVSPVLSVPFVGTSGGIFGYLLKPEQPVEDVVKNPLLNMEIIAPNYFSTLGVPIRRGRAFTEADRDAATLAMIVSEGAARAMWPGEDPLGKVVHFGRVRREYTIVGVVPETRYTELRTPRPTVYFPIRQSSFGGMLPLTLVIRASQTPSSLAPTLRTAVAGDPRVALVSIATLSALLDGPRAQPRLNALLLTAFALAAMLLAAVGLFGAIATTVRQRTRELGIRMALGATQGAVQRMVLIRGVVVAATGLAVGLAAGLVVNRTLGDLLFEVSPFDPTTIGVVAVLILGAAAIASAIPARSTARIDPVNSLRADV